MSIKYAVVTGATSGIGLAIAKKLLEDDTFVFINYAHDDQRAKEVALSLAEFSESFCLVKSDMSCLDGVERLTHKIIKQAPHINYLVFSSYATDKTEFGRVTPEKWQNVMNSNVNMPFFLMQSLFDHMHSGGAVTCIGSMMGIFPHAISLSYSVSKSALHMLCQSMVKIYAKKNITINAICPGFVETPMQFDKTPEQRARIESKIALGRFAVPEEIADACVKILNNGYINGAVIPVCGGYCMR